MVITRVLMSILSVALLTACQTRQMAHCPCANRLTLSGPGPMAYNEYREACQVIARVDYFISGSGASFPLSGQTVEFWNASTNPPTLLGSGTTDSNGQTRWTVYGGKTYARATIVVGNTLTSSQYTCETTPSGWSQ